MPKAVIECGFLAGGLSDDELVIGEEAAGLEHDRQLFFDFLFAATGKEGDNGFWGSGGA